MIPLAIGLGFLLLCLLFLSIVAVKVIGIAAAVVIHGMYFVAPALIIGYVLWAIYADYTKRQNAELGLPDTGARPRRATRRRKSP